jgi:uncharacterized protein YcaQ
VHAELVAMGGVARPVKEEWGWNWSVAKRVLEYLFFVGEVVSAGRTAQFARRYDLPSRVLPPAILHAPPVSDSDAIRALIEIGGRAHGVATPRDLADYFRLGGGGTRPLVAAAIRDLIDEGALVAVSVRAAGGARGAAQGESRSGPWYLHRDAAVPRRATGAGLLSPFDPLVFERSRLQELFDIHYRIEIYTPAHQRVHGYYVLPFREGERITARVDLKADRQAGVLQVQAAHRESWLTSATVGALAAELDLMAGWLGLGDIAVARRGDLAEALAVEVRRR